MKTVHANVGLDADGVKIDEEAFADDTLIFVAVDHVLEEGFRVRRRRRGQADLDGVEMLERVAPDRLLGGGIAAMAFVRDDDVEGVNRNVEQFGVVFGFIVALREHRLASEEIDGHALDRADVQKGMARLRVEQVGRRHDLGIEGLAFFEVFAAKALAVDFVNLVELEARFRLKGGEGIDSLGGEGAAIHKKEDAAGQAGFHQAIGPNPAFIW